MTDPKLFERRQSIRIFDRGVRAEKRNFLVNIFQKSLFCLFSKFPCSRLLVCRFDIRGREKKEPIFFQFADIYAKFIYSRRFLMCISSVNCCIYPWTRRNFRATFFCVKNGFLNFFRYLCFRRVYLVFVPVIPVLI